MKRIQDELGAYRAATKAKSGCDVYNLASEIVFTEGLGRYIQQVCEDNAALRARIEAAPENKTLAGCVKHVTGHARKTIGSHGDLPPEEMHMLVLDYYGR